MCSNKFIVCFIDTRIDMLQVLNVVLIKKKHRYFAFFNRPLSVG